MTTFQGFRCDQCGTERQTPTDNPPWDWYPVGSDGEHVCSTKCGRAWFLAKQAVLEEREAWWAAWKAQRQAQKEAQVA